ncbi:MAG: amino acid adenylation domain-containing protein [Candidatus Aminicenantes bacterium]|jgi:amino acid adenylation domain-containing protein
MNKRRDIDKLAVAAKQKTKEKQYWLKKLAGDLVKTSFPYDYEPKGKVRNEKKKVEFRITGDLLEKLLKLSKKNDYRMHTILTAGLLALLKKYTHSIDLLLGAPIYKQEVKAEFINTVLPLRYRITDTFTFKELVLLANETMAEAIKNYRYPLEILLEQLNMKADETHFPLFDIVILLDNIHDYSYIDHIPTAVTFGFSRTGEALEGTLEYNSILYEAETIQRLAAHFSQFLDQALCDVNLPLVCIDILGDEEKKRLLYEFNDTSVQYPGDKTIQQLFAEQVIRTPDRIALVGNEAAKGPVPLSRIVSITYLELDKTSHQLTTLLQKRGIATGMLVGIMMERSIDMIKAILAILKTGAGYLPIDPQTPHNRVMTMVEESQISLLISHSRLITKHSFTALQGLFLSQLPLYKTRERRQITDLDRIPIPDRSLVDYEKYNHYIGLAAVKDCMTLQATRGCPYKCAYCHKIWPKTHVKRSAEHIFSEVQQLYNLGIRRFSLIDDIFNLDIKNSGRFFEMVIKNGLDLQFFFPSGVRADILTKNYIDLMVNAGATSIALALETASPRLQKLIGKNLNVEKLRENAAYIIEKYPQVILELFTMHGFPTETEGEALMTLEFIKSLKWLHFPYIFTLRIYPNTDMEALAIKNGISRQSIVQSSHGGFHQLPDTLPFDKQFTLEYQSNFLNDYFLLKERLRQMLPYQMKVLTADEIVQKYNAYLSEEINCFADLLKLVGIKEEELGNVEFLADDYFFVPHLDEKLKHHFHRQEPGENALKVLILDLSTFFSERVDVFYDMIEPPLGPLYLLTYLNQQLGPRINGRILKSRMDFDNYDQLKKLLEDFKPDVIGVRTLTYYKNFFHQTITMIRQWGITVPIIAGGPYATSDYTTILQDSGIDLVVRGEGEITFCEIIEKIIENNGALPDETILKDIPGIAFIPEIARVNHVGGAREVIMLDQLAEFSPQATGKNAQRTSCAAADFAYCMYTSGTTGTPKGTLISHYNVTRLVKNSNYIDLIPNDRILQLSNYAFDGSVFDIYGALLNGAALVLLQQEDALALDWMLRTIEKENITVFFVTTALFNTLVDIRIEALKNTRKILFGGERVSVKHCKKALEYLGKDRIIHMYGPTESTVYATYYQLNRIDERWGTIPIGQPLANTTVYILDEHLNPVPIGAAGELYIGGKGLSAGYQNHAELTKEKFIPHPFIKEERLYRTGDLGRQLKDGNIEFLGRIDHQVKIRGMRIEPGEIEALLLTHREIREAVVLAREDKQGDKYLCTYIVSDRNILGPELRTYLSGELPAYMIPSYFERIDKIPISANGKVDRRALPQPSIKKIKDIPASAAQGDELEAKLAGIWSELLGIQKDIIDIHSNFFDLGGHSLKATILAVKVRKALEVNLPLAEVFKTPTISGLAGYIRKKFGNKYKQISIRQVEKKEYYELASAQKRAYIIQHMDLSNTAYNMIEVVPGQGDIEIGHLQTVFRKLIERHEVFRTSFKMINGSPRQVIHDAADTKIDFYDLEFQAPGEPVDRIEKHCAGIIKKFIRPFDLSHPPLLRVGVIKIDEKHHVLMVDMHHIISDAESRKILIREFKKIYIGEELTAVRLRYKDFSEWQNRLFQSEEIKKQEEYWLRLFTGKLPRLKMFGDYPGASVKTAEGDLLNFQINSQLTQQLRRFASDSKTTLFMVLLAAYNVLLSKYTRQEDIIVGTPIAGRRHSDLENVVGMFANTLALRNYPRGNLTFGKFLENVKDNALNAFENQDYPFEMLVEKLGLKREGVRNPLFDMVFNFVSDYSQDKNEKERTKSPLEISTSSYIQTATFDISLRCIEKKDVILFALNYRTALFRKETVERLSRHLKNILKKIVENPGVSLTDIDILGKQEKERVVLEFNRLDQEDNYEFE